jgi:hypothetical protein
VLSEGRHVNPSRIAARIFTTLALIFVAIQAAAAQDTQTSAPAPDAQTTSGDDDFFSRITVAVPVFTHHFPHDEDFDDNNWGGYIFGQVTGQFYLAAGDFTNSYKKNTAFVGAAWLPLDLNVSRIEIDAGGMVGVDLNGGYKGYDTLDPAIGALVVKLNGHYTDDPDYQFVNRAGFLVTVIPGVGANTSTAVNLALTYRL